MAVQRLAPGWPWRLAVLTPLGVYGFVYPFGIGLLLFGWMPPEAGWVGGCLLAAQGLAMAAWCGLNYGAARGLGAAGHIAGAAWALEALGVTTGVPFGAYRYSPALGAMLGPVPAAIPFAWIATVGAAFFTARGALPARLAAGALPVWLGAALATLQDAVLETIATRVQGYWTWTEPGAPYYGVPWANFATWFVAALILGTVWTFNNINVTYFINQNELETSDPRTRDAAGPRSSGRLTVYDAPTDANPPGWSR